jgi:hypothetical protein
MDMLDNQKEKAKALAESVMAGSDRAQARGVDLVVTLTVAALVAAFLIPVAVDQLVNVDTTNWGSGAASLWDIMDLVVVLAVFLFLIGVAISRSSM